MPGTRVRLCGPLAVEIDGRDATAALPSGQAESLLCFLLANRDRPVDRGELIAVVWPDRAPRDPQAALRPILSRLRRAIAPATIEGRERLRLALPEPVWLDVDQAAHELEQARRLAGAGSWEHARAAAELLAPGFLPHHDEDWARERRRQVEELALEALEWVGRGALASEEPAAAERAARELVARERYRESGHRLLMEALAAAGQRRRGAARLRRPAPPAARRPRRHARGRHRRAARAAGRGRGRARPRSRCPPSSPRAGAARSSAAPPSSAPCARRGRRPARAGAASCCCPARRGSARRGSTGELAQAAEGTVLYGSCPQEPLLSYQPFVEALRHYVRNAVHAVRPGTGAAELAQLIPELEVDPLPGPAPDDPETRRYLMFEAVSRLLSDACVRAPVLLVLDDLHWADRPTLQLLRHVLRAQDEAPLLIVGTHREGEAPAELGELLADLRRDRLLHGVSLAGLDEPGVAALIAAQAGHDAPSALVRTVHDETDGNPFFVEEVVRHLLESGRWTETLTPGQIGVPEGVKEVILRRLARLSEACRTALAHAAVLGREFDFETLRGMLAGDEDAVIAALEEALDARLVVEAPGGYAFTHALVRETLYGTLSVPRRQRMHARAAAASPDSALAALALHHRLAGPAGDPARGDRLLAARGRAGARAVRVGGRGGALGRGAGRHGAHRRGRGRARRAAGRPRRADGGDRRPRPPDRLPRARAPALHRAARRRARGADPLAARAGALADRLDLRRPPGHPARVPPLRRRARGARARARCARRAATSRPGSPPR